MATAEHLRLLCALLKQPPAINVLKSLCGYLEALAASQVPSVLFFECPVACQLAGILSTMKTDGSEVVICILRVFVELSRRSERMMSR